MGRKRVSAEERFAEAVQELGLEQAEFCLKMLKKFHKKSLKTDPDFQAQEKTSTQMGGENDKPIS